ncbi:BON domain-containing protein [Kaarinaea lacus]
MIRITIVLSLLIGLLSLAQGCGGLVVAGAAVGAVAVSDPRPSQVLMDDKILEMTATDKIYSDRELQTRVHINVNSYNYVVLLTGEALSQDLKDKVVDIARHLKNVRRVHNEIRVADLTSFEARAKDSWITSKVKTNMLGTKDLEATKVEVITESRTVYLMGFVSEEQGDKAADVARQVEGVEKVIKLFEYVKPDQTSNSQSVQN